jgi:hypothetical protein
MEGRRPGSIFFSAARTLTATTRSQSLALRRMVGRNCGAFEVRVPFFFLLVFSARCYSPLQCHNTPLLPLAHVVDGVIALSWCVGFFFFLRVLLLPTYPGGFFCRSRCSFCALGGFAHSYCPSFHFNFHHPPPSQMLPRRVFFRDHSLLCAFCVCEWLFLLFYQVYCLSVVGCQSGKRLGISLSTYDKATRGTQIVSKESL